MNIELRVIITKDDKQIARQIIENYHSYVPMYKSVGRRIDWLIYIDGIIKGVIGIGSSTYPPCKDLLKKLNITKNEYKLLFNHIANNWRFCMKEKIPNAGTKILKEMRNLCQFEWYKKYGDELKYLITFVGGGKSGAVYKADNWEEIGFTAGLPQHKSVSMKWNSSEELKQKFVKPDGINKKIIFFKELKNMRMRNERSN